MMTRTFGFDEAARPSVASARKLVIIVCNILMYSCDYYETVDEKNTSLQTLVQWSWHVVQHIYPHARDL